MKSISILQKFGPSTKMQRRPRRDLDNDFRSHVEGGWENVHPVIRARMDQLLTSPDDTTFKGYGVVRRSVVGWFFAQASRLFGGPLVVRQGENVKTVVRIAPTENGLRCWHRSFVFEDGHRQLVQTTKLASAEHGMMDSVGAQGEKMLATKMRVWAKENSLFFQSTACVLRMGRFHLPLPMIFTPGILFAEHRDLGDGTFRYILKFNHPLWGETFYQDGAFIQTEEAI